MYERDESYSLPDTIFTNVFQKYILPSLTDSELSSKSVWIIYFVDARCSELVSEDQCHQETCEEPYQVSTVLLLLCRLSQRRCLSFTWLRSTQLLVPRWPTHAMCQRNVYSADNAQRLTTTCQEHVKGKNGERKIGGRCLYIY